MDQVIDRDAFVDIDFAGQAFRVWNGDVSATPTWHSEAFLPSHAIGQSPLNIISIKDRSKNSQSIHLTIADPATIALFRGAVGGHIKAVLVVGTLTEIYERVQAEIDISSVSFNKESGELTVALSLKDFLMDDRGITRRAAVLNAATQRRVDATDFSTEYLIYLQRQTVFGRWGPPPGARRQKKSLFGAILGAVIGVVIAVSTAGIGWQAALAGFSGLLQIQQARKADAAAKQIGEIDTRIEIINNSPEPYRRFVFGECLVGGDMLYMGVAEKVDTLPANPLGARVRDDDSFLQLMVAIADHPIAEIKELWIGNGRYDWDAANGTVSAGTDAADIPDGETDYADLVVVAERLDGTSTLILPSEQTRSETRTRERGGGEGEGRTTYTATIITQDGWKANINDAGEDKGWNPARHKATGMAIAGVQFKYEQKRIIPYQNARFLVRGYNEVYDPRTQSVGYSDNPALIIGAYLNVVGGLPYQRANGTIAHRGVLTQAEVDIVNAGIDVDSIAAAADICEARGWRVAGAIDLDEPLNKGLNGLAAAMAGWWFFDGERVKVLAGTAATPNTRTIGNNDVMNIDGRFNNEARHRYNQVGGSHSNDPDNGRYEATGYPELIDAVALAADAHAPYRVVQDFPFVPKAKQCLELASIGLARVRAGGDFVIDVPAHIGRLYSPGERVVINLTEPFGLDGTWRLTQIDEDWDACVYQLTLSPDPDSVYALNATEIDGLVANIATSAPIVARAPRLSPPESLTLQANDEGGVIAPDGTHLNGVLAVVRGGGAERFVEVERQVADGWVAMATGASLTNQFDEGVVNVGNHRPGTSITPRARFVDRAGIASDWMIGSTFIVPADTTAPDAPAYIRVLEIRREAVDLLIAGVAARDLAGFDLRYTIAAFGTVPPVITNEAEWNAASVIENRSAVPLDSGDYRVSFFLTANGRVRIYGRPRDRSNNLGVISQAASVVFDYRDASGQIFNSEFGINGDQSWSGVALTDFIIGADGVLLPESGRSGAASDASGDSVAIYNNQSGWWLKPSDTQSSVGLTGAGRITLPANVDATMSVDVEGLYAPGGDGFDIAPHIQRRWRQRHNGVWSAWADMPYQVQICADAVEVIVNVNHALNIPASYGIKNLAVRITALVAETIPADVVIAPADANNGVFVGYGAVGFVSPPQIFADIEALASGVSGAIEDYVVEKTGATAQGATLKIKRRGQNVFVGGTIRWSAKGAK